MVRRIKQRPSRSFTLSVYGFRFLGVEGQCYTLESTQAALLQEFCNRGLFRIVSQDQSPNGRILFERTECGKKLYERLLPRLEQIFNDEMAAAESEFAKADQHKPCKKSKKAKSVMRSPD